jgi:hypothetical protein
MIWNPIYVRNFFLTVFLVIVLALLRYFAPDPYPYFFFSVVGDIAPKIVLEDITSFKKIDTNITTAKLCTLLEKTFKRIPVLTIENQIGNCIKNHPKGSRGNYPEYYLVDYPPKKTLARFIFIDPSIDYSNEMDNKVDTTYATTTSRFRFLEDSILEARNQKIPWIIVAMSETCISLDKKGCSIGEDLMNYLLRQSVDLIIQTESDAYTRTRQLVCVETDRLKQSCISDSMQNYYEQGNGSVVVLAGQKNVLKYKDDLSEGDAQYFSLLVRDTGSLVVEVTKNILEGKFITKIGARDSFMMTR